MRHPGLVAAQRIFGIRNGTLRREGSFHEPDEIGIAGVLRLIPDGARQGQCKEDASVFEDALATEKSGVIAEEPSGLEMDDDQIEKLLLRHRERNRNQIGIGLKDAAQFGTTVGFAPKVTVLLREGQEVAKLARAGFATKCSGSQQRAEN